MKYRTRKTIADLAFIIVFTAAILFLGWVIADSLGLG